jgi:hypothetical protein
MSGGTAGAGTIDGIVDNGSTLGETLTNAMLGKSGYKDAATTTVRSVPPGTLRFIWTGLQVPPISFHWQTSCPGMSRSAMPSQTIQQRVLTQGPNFALAIR